MLYVLRLLQKIKSRLFKIWRTSRTTIQKSQILQLKSKERIDRNHLIKNTLESFKNFGDFGVVLWMTLKKFKKTKLLN